jgi:hypothetical protein
MRVAATGRRCLRHTATAWSLPPSSVLSTPPAPSVATWFLTQYTACFAVAYVFIIMEIESRRIVHFNVTINPTLLWVKQQIREATA